MGSMLEFRQGSLAWSRIDEGMIQLSSGGKMGWCSGTMGCVMSQYGS